MRIMQDSLHPLSPEMDPPALWDQMELDTLMRAQLNHGTNPLLLERLGMDDIHGPLLLQRLDMNKTLGMNQLGDLHPVKFGEALSTSSTLLNQFKAAINLLPLAIPIGINSDDLAAFSVNPPWFALIW